MASMKECPMAIRDPEPIGSPLADGASRERAEHMPAPPLEALHQYVSHRAPWTSPPCQFVAAALQ